MKRVLLVGIVVGLLGCEDEDGISGFVPIGGVDTGAEVTMDASLNADVSADVVVYDADTVDVPTASSLDASPDGAPDAPPPLVATHTGTIEILDVRLRNMRGPGVDGYGVSLHVAFNENAQIVAPFMEESANVLDRCKAWQYTPSQWAMTVGSDEGPVQITATDGSPAFPPCLFTTGVGYTCPDTASSGVGGSLTSTGAPAASSLFVASGNATFGAEDVGRYLRLANTGVSALNSSFPIVAIVNATTVVVSTGAGINLTLPASATFVTLAGAGPMPGASADTFFTNTENLTVAKATSANFDAFPANAGFILASGIGDDFALGTAGGKVLPTQIPLDGSAFTIGCDSTADCGQAVGSVLELLTTDAPLGTSPFSFPAAITKSIRIRCVKVGATQITVPAAYSALLSAASSGATRIQTRFMRLNLAGAGNQSGAPNVTNIAAGHAELGYTTVPQL
ncbi:MAG: hypothetical protein SF187_22375 [Deltaproteobacteria bacterium]|nr:hypothetical protein [Deltaproteobacteria bacterium]